MNVPDVEGATQYALTRLLSLPASFVYHSVTHTRDSVVPAAERLATMAGIDDDALVLLRTAAWYHDIGFAEQRSDHEVAGVRIAAKTLPGFGYTQSQIATIAGMIMATKLPQAPQTRLEELLADADLDVLGRTDFWDCNRALRAELAAFGVERSDQQWYRDQLQFLQNHQYWTAPARAFRDVGKKVNMRLFRQLLSL